MNEKQVLDAAKRQGIKQDRRTDFTQPREWLQAAAGYLESARQYNTLVKNNRLATRQAAAAIRSIEKAQRDVALFERIVKGR